MTNFFALIGFGAVVFLGYSVYLTQQRRQQELELENKKRFHWFNRRNQICLN